MFGSKMGMAHGLPNLVSIIFLTRRACAHSLLSSKTAAMVEEVQVAVADAVAVPEEGQNNYLHVLVAKGSLSVSVTVDAGRFIDAAK